MNMETKKAKDQDLTACIKAMKNAPVLVVGDIMLDRFVYGDVERISPESPVPVLSIAREDAMLGGAGNALANLAGLAADGKILSVIGDDEAGKQLLEKARALRLDTSGLVTDGERPTIVKTRYLAGHQQLLRTDSERKAPVSDTMADEILRRAKVLVKEVGAVIISDYGKGLMRKELVAKIIGMAGKAKVPVIVDPKGRDFSLYKGADVITPNKKELAEATGLPVESDEDVVKAAQSVIKNCGIKAVVATRSGDGMSVVRKGQDPLHLRTVDIEVFDVSGAGDSVIATIAAGLAAGADLAEAAALANVAGSVVVSKVGTAPIRAKELIEAVNSDHGDALTRAGGNNEPVKSLRQAELLEWNAAAEQVRRWRARGLKVGFTNGCFDVLHAGHVSYLNDARSNCDRLVVGLNHDVSVKILKGEDRPVHDELARADVLGALSSVDLIVLFGAKEKGGDNTACDLLELLQPDIYFKGGDYKVKDIPEAPIVQTYGGEVSVMPVYEGHSTTSSIKKIKNKAA